MKIKIQKVLALLISAAVCTSLNPSVSANSGYPAVETGAESGTAAGQSYELDFTDRYNCYNVLSLFTKDAYVYGCGYDAGMNALKLPVLYSTPGYNLRKLNINADKYKYMNIEYYVDNGGFNSAAYMRMSVPGCDAENLFRLEKQGEWVKKTVPAERLGGWSGEIRMLNIVPAYSVSSSSYTVENNIYIRGITFFENERDALNYSFSQGAADLNAAYMNGKECEIRNNTVYAEYPQEGTDCSLTLEVSAGAKSYISYTDEGIPSQVTVISRGGNTKIYSVQCSVPCMNINADGNSLFAHWRTDGKKLIAISESDSMGRLSFIKTADISVKKGDTTDITDLYGMGNDLAGKKMTVWDSIETMKPVSRPYTVSLYDKYNLRDKSWEPVGFADKKIKNAVGYPMLVWEKTPGEPDGVHSLWDGTESPQFSGGDGTKNNPYQIKNAGELYHLAKLLNGSETYNLYAGGSYVLTDDIYINPESVFNRYVWDIPIGTASRPFKGNFDGNGHVIHNIYFQGSYRNCTSGNTFSAGLFGTIDGAEVKNTGIDGASALLYDSYNLYAGMLVGAAHGNSVITECFVRNAELAYYSTWNSGAGAAFAGELESSVKISDCYSVVRSMKYTYSDGAGIKTSGFAGISAGAEIVNCYAANVAYGDHYSQNSEAAFSSDGADKEMSIRNCFVGFDRDVKEDGMILFADSLRNSYKQLGNKFKKSTQYMTGGEGGQVCTDIEMDSNDGRFIVSFTDTGGIFRSMDGGLHWEQAGRNINNESVSVGAIDPNNSKRVIAATFRSESKMGTEYSSLHSTNSGLYLSEDNAYSFKQTLVLSDEKQNLWRDALAFDASSYDEEMQCSRTVYYSSPGGSEENSYFNKKHAEEKGAGLNSGSGLYRSDDGGYTWKCVNPDMTNGYVKVNPISGAVYFGSENGFYRSIDKGESFEKILGLKITGMDVIQTIPNRVYISASDGIYISDNSGLSFEKVEGDWPGNHKTAYESLTGEIRVSPVNPMNMLIAYAANLSDCKSFVSHDGGRTWNSSQYCDRNDFYLKTVRRSCFAWSPVNENIVWSAGTDRPVFSDSAGDAFIWKSDGNLGTCINSRFIPNVYNPSLWFVPAQDNDGAFTLDNGKTFTAVNRFSTVGYDMCHIYGAYCVDENTFFFTSSKDWESSKRDIYVTYDCFKTLEKVGTVESGSATGLCLQSPTESNVWFAANMRSEDNGKTWTDMSAECKSVLTYNKNGAKELYGIGKTPDTVVVSYDSGRTWSELFKCSDRRGVNYNSVTSAAYDSFSGILYFTNYGTLLKFADGAVTSLDRNIRQAVKGTFLTNVAIDHSHPGIIYVSGQAAGGQSWDNFANECDNLLRSCDGGNSFEILSSGSDRSIVKNGPRAGTNCRALFVSTIDGYVYSGGANFGLYKFAPPY